MDACSQPHCLCIGELFIPLSTTVVVGGVISIRGAGASVSSPNTPAEAASEDYWEQAEVIANHVAQLYNTYLVFWCFVPSFALLLAQLPRAG